MIRTAGFVTASILYTIDPAHALAAGTHSAGQMPNHTDPDQVTSLGISGDVLYRLEPVQGGKKAVLRCTLGADSK
jgi:hypothetical protein